MLLAFAVACFTLCGCQTIYDRIADSVGEEEQMSADAAAKFCGEPRIQPGIVLIIQVGTIAAPPTKMEVMVDQNGDITLPLLLQDPVACGGLTLEALKKKLIVAYSKYYRQPMVTVTFAPYDGKGVSPWGTVTVLGQVSNPGPVNMPATMDLTVTKALQAAGHCKPFADKTRIRVSRCDKDGKITHMNVNIDEIGKDGRVDKDILLRSGDAVWVPETWY